MTIEMVRVGRPKKVLAILAAVISLILFVCSYASTSWVLTKTQRMGLLQRCAVPQDSSADSSACSFIQIVAPLDWKTWHALGCLVIAAAVLLFTLLGIVLFLAGTLTLAVRRKSVLYKAVLVLLTIAALLMATCLVIFPIGCWLWANGDQSRTTTISIGWPVYAGCIGTVLLVVAIALLTSDRKSEEVAYKEVISRA